MLRCTIHLKDFTPEIFICESGIISIVRFVPFQAGVINFRLYRPLVTSVSNEHSLAPMNNQTQGGTFLEMERKTNDSNWTFELTGKTREMVNLGSYNYLGYAENHGFCNDQVLKSIDQWGVGVGSSRNDFGTYKIHQELEKKWSKVKLLQLKICNQNDTFMDHKLW